MHAPEADCKRTTAMCQGPSGSLDTITLWLIYIADILDATQLFMPWSPLKGTVQQVYSVLGHEEIIRKEFAALKTLLRVIKNAPSTSLVQLRNFNGFICYLTCITRNGTNSNA